MGFLVAAWIERRCFRSVGVRGVVKSGEKGLLSSGLISGMIVVAAGGSGGGGGKGFASCSALCGL